ncbi:hypothetical protein JANAI62_22050 [Jannaschia pagri]|uniref:Uncharacterized protein n=1 Tax=Jannaschia pagri TaxID=2829797 RepID=A0ABQ4NME8_9RHOB|nr:hypothetical protein JANAI62_22050 [Jannaschia sp. AI_62]
MGPADLSIVQTHLEASLRDPESLRFRHAEGFRTVTGDRIVCGEYNAKNGFGGYVGYQPYYVRLRQDQVAAAYFGSSLARLGCERARLGEINVPRAAS